MKLSTIRKQQNGFTLIELLVVIGILAILLAITLIAINPNKHFQDTRNAKRSSDVSAILDAIYEYESANNGSQPPAVAGVTSTPTPIGGVDEAATNTTFATPALTLSGFTSNPVSSGSTATLTGCTNTANNGTYPVTAGNATSVTVTNANGVASDTGCSITGWSGRINLCPNVVPTFLAALPMDPGATGTACQGNFDTDYTIASTSGRFTIAAPDAEGSATITVTR